MPLTSNDFKLLNSNPLFVNELNTTLKYLSLDPQLGAMMQQAATLGYAIMYNPFGNKMVEPKLAGATVFGRLSDGTPVVLWNPDAGALVWGIDSQGNHVVTGIQSAAAGLMHELIGHGLNPANDAQSTITDIEYEYVNERVAVTIEATINQTILNEPTRNNHDGVDIPVHDPTLHTITTEDGALQLAWMGPDGQPVYGPQIATGTPQWNNLQAFGKQVAAELNNSGVNVDHQHDPTPVIDYPSGDGIAGDPPSPFSDPNSGGSGAGPTGGFIPTGHHDSGGGDDGGGGNDAGNDSGGDRGDPGAIGAGDNDDPDHQPSTDMDGDGLPDVGDDHNAGSNNDGAVDGPLPNLDPYNGHKPQGTVANVQTGTGNNSLVAHQEQTTPQSATSTSHPAPPVAVSHYSDPGIVMVHAADLGFDDLLAHHFNPPAAADGVAIGDTMVFPTVPHHGIVEVVGVPPVVDYFLPNLA